MALVTLPLHSTTQPVQQVQPALPVEPGPVVRCFAFPFLGLVARSPCLVSGPPPLCQIPRNLRRGACTWPHSTLRDVPRPRDWRGQFPLAHVHSSSTHIAGRSRISSPAVSSSGGLPPEREHTRHAARSDVCRHLSLQEGISGASSIAVVPLAGGPGALRDDLRPQVRSA